MRITFINLIISVFACSASYAQNTAWPSATSSDKVGIGNNSPFYNLQVQKTSNQPAVMIGGGYPGSPRLQIYGLDADGQAYMGLGTDMAGGPYEHSIFFSTGPSYAPGKLTIGDYNGSQYNTRFTILQNGNVGIGTNNPNVKLDVNGIIGVGDFAFVSSLRNSLNSYTNLLLGGAIRDNGNGSYTVNGDGGSNYFSAIRMDNQGGNAGAINFYNGASTGGSSYTVSNVALSNYQRMTIVGDKVGIGTSTPDAKLAVNGTIHTREVKVDMNGWSDYVFKPTYHLPSLASVKSYIDKNQHLPDMPSEQEVIKDGVNLGDMNKLLLKKVEELTLYLIKQQKENERQNAHIARLEEALTSKAIVKKRR